MIEEEQPGTRSPVVVVGRANRRRVEVHQLYAERTARRARRSVLSALTVLVTLAVAAGVMLHDDGGRASPVSVPAAPSATVTAPPDDDDGPVRGAHRVARGRAWSTTGRLRSGRSPPSGACGTNQQVDAGSATTFYLEQQSCAEDVVIPALLAGDTASVDVGLQALDWAFAREDPDGAFPGESDAFHSTSIFLASAARVVLLLRESPFAAQYSARLQPYGDALARAAAYEVKPSVLRAGRAGDVPYGHRRFLLGTAIGLVADVTGSAALQAKARGFLRDGMALQLSDGEIPELGGPETHYQTYGMMFAIEWVSENPGDRLAAPLTATIDRALAWESSRVAADGEVSIAGNTRTAGQERNRDGSPKKLIYHDVVRALASWGLMRDSSALLDAAKSVAAYKRAHPGA